MGDIFESLGFRVVVMRIESCGKNSGDLFESFRV